jgi:hypothetical protein
MSDEITVVDLNRVEGGAHDFAQVYVTLQKQAVIAQFILDDMKAQGRGRWVRQLQRDVRMLVTYLETASELAAEICADLDDLLEEFVGEPDQLTDDCDEYPEEYE